MRNSTFTAFLIILTSCFPEGDLGDVTYTTLINNSGHNIEIQEYYNGSYQTSIFIDNKNEYELIGGDRDPGSPTGPSIRPLFNSDSVRVYYYEKASIWHTTNVNSPVSKSLMLESSYQGGKVSEGRYEFTYTFTPEDFDEAVLYGD